MAEEMPPPEAVEPVPEAARARRPLWVRVLKALARAALVLVLVAMAALGVGAIYIESPAGHRAILNRIAAFSPANGLRIRIDRFDGSLLGGAVLRDVTLSDPAGPFLTVPVVELDWRPLHWFTSGLDIRKLVLRYGTLLRVPHFRPGADPNAPILPDYAIRIARFEFDRLTIAKGIAGDQRLVGLRSSVDIRKGRAVVKTDGRLGGGDRLHLLVDSEPDRGIFSLALDYAAPKGGLLAGLTGEDRDLAATVSGAGDWKNWQGFASVDGATDGANTSGGGYLAQLALGNKAGHYTASGSLRPELLPARLLSPMVLRAAGDRVEVKGEGTFADNVLDGQVTLAGAGLAATGQGTVDLGHNRAKAVKLDLATRRSDLLGPGISVEGAHLTATVNGPFNDLSASHSLTVARAASGSTRVEGVSLQGTARWDGKRLTLPAELTLKRLSTGNPSLDPRLVNGTARGTLVLAGNRLSSDRLTLAMAGVGAALMLEGDTARGTYALRGPIAARGVPVPQVGTVDGEAQAMLSLAGGGWKADARFTGRLARVDNATLTSLAGDGIHFAGHVAAGDKAPLTLDGASIAGSKLAATLGVKVLADGRTAITGAGKHSEYGPFTLEAELAKDGPHAVLTMASPLPAAGLKNVRLALTPIEQGFHIETKGDSRLGPFAGTLGLTTPNDGPSRLAVEQMTIWKTAITGSLLLEKVGVDGALALKGGGVDGTITLAPEGGGQGASLAITLRDANFGGSKPLALRAGRLEGKALFHDGHSAITGKLRARGVSQGALFLGGLNADLALADGQGTAKVTLAGRRGSGFALALGADIAPQRIALLAAGQFAGDKIAMPRRAVLTSGNLASGGQGWTLAPTEVDFAKGRFIAEGHFGDTIDLHFAVDGMPLALADIMVDDLGLGGTASGDIHYLTGSDGVPTGTARLEVKGLSRSGLLLVSRPIDMALNAKLTARTLESRAVLSESGKVVGRVQGLIDRLPEPQAGTSFVNRLQAGHFFAQLRYNGPVDALWRLLALDSFDLTGPVSLSADAEGRLDDPAIRGQMSSTALRLQSSLIGADIQGIVARGSFAGSRLELTSLAGKARNGGQVTGSGSVDFTGLGSKPPAIDLKLAARNAELIARDDMGATVTGPIRIVSHDGGGTIAGRLTIDKARWVLGKASAAADLPDVAVHEANLPADIAPAREANTIWHYLVDVKALNRITVTGMGLDSEWGGDLRIRGTTAMPTILGQVDVVRGAYEFAGKRFDMSRGRINFDGSAPINPRVDIAASADVTGLTANVTVTGTADKPNIVFSSTPTLPEEEVLSRLLFGSSITQISAPEAVQLAASLAALRGGGGLDPINKLRKAVGLDRLRVVSPDATIGRGTSVAAGKYISSRLYGEVISDGHGYNATSLEFRIFKWLSILATVSTNDKQSLNVKVSKDY